MSTRSSVVGRQESGELRVSWHNYMLCCAAAGRYCVQVNAFAWKPVCRSTAVNRCGTRLPLRGFTVQEQEIKVTGIFLLIHTAGVMKDLILLCIRLCIEVSAKCKSL